MSWVNVEIERVRRGETTCLDLSLPYYIAHSGHDGHQIR